MVACGGVGRIYCFQSPSATVDFRPNFFVTIDDYVGRKLEVIARSVRSSPSATTWSPT